MGFIETSKDGYTFRIEVTERADCDGRDLDFYVLDKPVGAAGDEVQSALDALVGDLRDMFIADLVRKTNRPVVVARRSSYTRGKKKPAAGPELRVCG
jgi:hypothetical protein